MQHQALDFHKKRSKLLKSHFYGTAASETTPLEPLRMSIAQSNEPPNLAKIGSYSVHIGYSSTVSQHAQET